MKIGQQTRERSTVAAVAAAARPLEGAAEEIARRLAAGRIVLPGEASHGTGNFTKCVRKSPGGWWRSTGSTYAGTVMAADNWDDDSREMAVNPALPGSCQETFHHAVMIHIDRTTAVRPLDAHAAPAFDRGSGQRHPSARRRQHPAPHPS